MIPRPASVELLDGVAATSALSSSSSSDRKSSGKKQRRHPAYPDLPPPRTKCQRCLHKVRTCLVSGMERLFFHHGRAVAAHPAAAVAVCLLVAVGCGAGMIRFKKENTNVKLWISERSSTRINTDWLWSHYPPPTRFSSMIFEDASDVLRPEVIRAMYRVRKGVDRVVTKYGDTWRDLCQPIPVVKPPNLGDVFGIGGGGGGGGGKTKEKKSQKSNTGNRSKGGKDDFDSFFDGGGGGDFFDDDFDFDDGFFDAIRAVDNLDGEEEKEEPGIGYAEYLSASEETYPYPYCDMVSSMPTACLENSILELWAEDGEYSDEAFEALTREDILLKINAAEQFSGVFLVQKNFTELLAGVTRDAKTDKIVAAKATQIRWIGRMNGTAAKLNPAPGRAEPIDPRMLELEGEMIKVMLNTSGYPDGLESYPNTHRSFGDIASATILGDVGQLGIGYTIVFCYVLLMLGRFNCVEHRAWLAACGVFSVVMGIVASYGACAAAGVFFGPMNNCLPFLLLGIGIDDMFVIVQCWDSIEKEEKEEEEEGEQGLPAPLPDRVGRALQRAGAAITVTSATDVMAFGVGASTVLPALRAFCLFAAAGVVAVYFFQLTFFVACFSWDRRRVEDRRNACCLCCRHRNWSPKVGSRTSLLTSAFAAYARCLTRPPAKLLVLALCAGVTGVAVWGNVLLEQRFDVAWFMPPDSYVGRWFAKNRQLFPSGGDRVILYLHGLDYAGGDLERLDGLVRRLENQTDIIDGVDAWSSKFIRYYNDYFANVSSFLPDHPVAPEALNARLAQFLFSPRGGRYRERFSFVGEVGCGRAAPEMLLAEVTFTHRQFSGPREQIPAMKRVKSLIAEANFTDSDSNNNSSSSNSNSSNASVAGGVRVFPLSNGYTQWETDEVIAYELYRNLALAITCVGATTLLLLSDLLSSFLVLSSVVLTLVDVAGFMHFWGLTIDTVSACLLIIAIGLSVDYSAHVAHAFMSEQGGGRDDRAAAALVGIGPAVLNGGVSTFIAFILLATSVSHVFKTFFRVFFLVVVFGLFHGLVILPVLLSLVGPEPNGGNLFLGASGGGGGGDYVACAKNEKEEATELADRRKDMADDRQPPHQPVGRVTMC